MCQSEVHQLHIAGSVDHEILRLEVTMHDALSMCFMKSLADLLGDIESRASAQYTKTIQNPSKTLAFNEFHGDKGDAVGVVEIVDAANVLVCNLSCEPQLVLESLHERRLVRNFGFENLERDDLSRLAIACLKDETH